jgi:hypothetical protein
MALQFISGLAQVGERPEIDAVPGGEFVRALPKALSGESVKEAVRDVVREMTDYLDSMATGKGPFVLDEAEMTLYVDQSGKVNLILADIGGKVSGGIRLKWKRQDAQVGQG